MLKRITLTALVLFWIAACGKPNASQDQDKDYSKMNTVPLRTQCIGRMLIDLPQKADLNWSQEFDDSKVGKINAFLQTEDEFGTFVEKRRQELANTPHDTEGHLLHLFKKVDAYSAILLFRESNTDVYGYNIERYLWLGHWGYLLKSGIGNDGINQLDSLGKVLSLLIPIDITAAPPQQPGFCIDGALVTGDVGGIDASISMKMPGWKKVSLYVATGENSRAQPSVNPNDTPYMDLEREYATIRKLTKEIPGAEKDPAYPKEFITLRKQERMVGGRKGQDVIWRQHLNNGAVLYQFNWSNIDPSGSSSHPGISLELKVGDQYEPSEPPPESELLALWDAVLATLRPRLGAL